MMRFMVRLSSWLWSVLVAIKPIEAIDWKPTCAICGVALLPDGRHDFGATP